MFQYLTETLHNIDTSITIPNNITFTLQNGDKYLQKYFNQVNITKYYNKLEITNTTDLVDFIYSVSSIEGLKHCDREKIYDYYEHKKNSKGIIPIDIEYGIFIAKK